MEISLLGMDDNLEKKQSNDKKCAMCSVDESVLNQIKASAALDNENNKKGKEKEKSSIIGRIKGLFKRKSD